MPEDNHNQEQEHKEQDSTQTSSSQSQSSNQGLEERPSQSMKHGKTRTRTTGKTTSGETTKTTKATTQTQSRPTPTTGTTRRKTMQRSQVVGSICPPVTANTVSESEQKSQQEETQKERKELPTVEVKEDPSSKLEELPTEPEFVQLKKWFYVKQHCEETGRRTPDDLEDSVVGQIWISPQTRAGIAIVVPVQVVETLCKRGEEAEALNDLVQEALMDTFMRAAEFFYGEPLVPLSQVLKYALLGLQQGVKDAGAAPPPNTPMDN